MYKNLISIEKYLNLPSLINLQNLSFTASNDKFEKFNSGRQMIISNAIKLLACDKH